MKNVSGDLLADSHNILNTSRWKNCISQLLNVHRVSDIRQIEIHTAELLVPDPSPFEVEIAIEMLEEYKLSDSGQILAELIQAGGETYSLRFVNSSILFTVRKNCLISGRSLLLYHFTRRAIKLTVVIIVGCHSYQLYTTFYPISFSQG
jgi:hypothetical protein